jgi:hypothetical protein
MSTSRPHDLSEAHSSKVEANGPERLCVACRERFPHWQLLRVVMEPNSSIPLIDYLGKLPGRGAYICPNMRCIEQAIQRGGLSKTFRHPINATSDVLMKSAWAASRRQIRSLVSLAYRAGKLMSGHSNVEWGLKKQQGELLMLAQDVSVGVQRKFRRWAKQLEIPVYESLSKLELGPCVGVAESALILITDLGFATKIERELQRSSRLVLMVD